MEIHKNLYLIATITLFTVGIYLRAIGGIIEPNPLWGDEVLWIQRFERLNVYEYGFRPIWFGLLTKFLIDLNISSITVLCRLISFTSSVISIFLIYKIAKKIYKNKLSILFLLFLFILHPIHINLAKEFKPYAFEIMLHLILYLNFLNVESKKPSNLLLLFLLVIWTFSYNILFVYPTFFILFFYNSRNDIKVLIKISITALLVIALGILIKIFIINLYNRDTVSTIAWAQKRNIFILSDELKTIFLWYLNKTKDLYLLPISHKSFSDIFKSISIFLYIPISLFGLVKSIKSKNEKQIAYALAGILSTTVVLNILGFWPYGAFRTNNFLIFYFLIIFVYGIDKLLIINKFKFYIKIYLLITFINFSLINPKFYTTKHAKYQAGNPNTDKVIEFIHRNTSKGMKNLILFDWHTIKPLNFYLTRKDLYDNNNVDILKNNIIKYAGLNLNDTFKSIVKNKENKKYCDHRFFVIITKLRIVKKLEKMILDEYSIIDSKNISRNKYQYNYGPYLIEIDNRCIS